MKLNTQPNLTNHSTHHYKSGRVRIVAQGGHVGVIVVGGGWESR